MHPQHPTTNSSATVMVRSHPYQTRVNEYHSSFDLQPEFALCCARIMGLPPPPPPPAPTTTSESYYDEKGGLMSTSLSSSSASSSVHVINLLSISHSSETQDEEEEKEAAARACHHYVDPFHENALRIDESIRQMSNLLQRKRAAYVDVYASLLSTSPATSATTENYGNKGGDAGGDGAVMSEGERSILESTVASFAASTANQIESLRQMVMPSGGNGGENDTRKDAGGVGDLEGHRAGIISYLLLRLRHDVAQPMNEMQKERRRGAVYLLQNPHLCQLPPTRKKKTRKMGNNKSTLRENNEDDILEMLESEMDDGYYDMEDRRFMPKRTKLTHEEQLEEDAFRSLYYEGEDNDALARDLKPPVSKLGIPRNANKDGKETVAGRTEKLSARTRRQDKMTTTNISSQQLRKQQQPSVLPTKKGTHTVHHNSTQHNINNDLITLRNDEQEETYVEQLQQESALLTSSLQNELDDVRRVEQRMTEITALLTQFSSIVAEQQEEIISIHENTQRSKSNVDKGQEQLVKATEYGEKSKHWMAKFIFGLGLILLFFNWITP